MRGNLSISQWSKQLPRAFLVAGEGSRQLGGCQRPEREQQHPCWKQPRIPPQRRKRRLKRRRRAWDAPNLAQRFVKRVEPQFHHIVPAGFGIAPAAEPPAPDAARDGHVTRRDSESCRLRAPEPLVTTLAHQPPRR